MDIYPIVDGQKPRSANAIPPRPHSDEPPAAQPKEDELINFGHDGQPTTDLPKAIARPSVEKSDPKFESTGEISGLLKSTGDNASQGPLLNFHEDLKKSIPGLRREDTSDSQEFVDAKE